jgi:hypothetical protein
MARCRDLALDLVSAAKGESRQNDRKRYGILPKSPRNAGFRVAGDRPGRPALCVQPPAPDRCDALVAELTAIIARGQAAGIGPQ